MISRRQFVSSLTAVAASVAAGKLFGSDARACSLPVDGTDPVLDQYASTALKDLQAQVRVVSAEQAELAKINRDFGMAYRLKSLTMRYKEPNKLRMEGSIGSIVINGAARHFSVPALKISKTDDLGDSPGKRYTLMDIGLLTRAALGPAINSRYLKDEALGDVQARLFEVNYRGDDSVRYVLWIDPKTRLIVKREWFGTGGKKKATFLYQQPMQVSADLWVPTRIEIRNLDDVVAGITAYSDVKVNQGLDDALFKIG